MSIVPGPLLLATTGGRHGKVKTMPLSTSTAFTPTKELLTEAWKAVSCDPHNPDPDLELARGQEPKWSTHSLRRLADTVARRYREVTGVTEDEIDLYFGWNERVLLKAMQVHYATLSIRERMKRGFRAGRRRWGTRHRPVTAAKRGEAGKARAETMKAEVVLG